MYITDSKNKNCWLSETGSEVPEARAQPLIIKEMPIDVTRQHTTVSNPYDGLSVVKCWIGS